MRRLILMALGALAVVLTMTGGTAQAHVLVDTVEPGDDGSARVTLVFDHSCAQAPTTALEVELPAGTQVLATDAPEGWTAEVGDQRVDFSGPGLQADTDHRFAMEVRLIGTVGQTMRFPTRQICSDGDGYYWADPDTTGEEPAPSFVATAAVLSTPPADAAPSAPSGGASLVHAASLLAIVSALVTLLVYAIARRRPER